MARGYDLDEWNFVNLDDEEHSKRFAEAKVYAKVAVVLAMRITEDGLKNEAYRHLEVWPRENGGHEVRTYVMREENGTRKPFLENAREVFAGEWLVINPQVLPSDKTNVYAMTDEEFQKRYEPDGREGMFRARGMARIIKNMTGKKVWVRPPWDKSGVQEGDAECYFCAPYDPQNHEDLAEGKRYILSKNDAEVYGIK